MKETKVIHVTEETIADSFAYLVNSVDVVCADIATSDDGECTVAIVTEYGVILADVSEGKVQRFQAVKDSNMPKPNALITLTVMCSDSKYDDVSVEWTEDTEGYDIVFTRDR